MTRSAPRGASNTPQATPFAGRVRGVARERAARTTGDIEHGRPAAQPAPSGALGSGPETPVPR